MNLLQGFPLQKHILLIAPFCSESSSPWFSPGRYRKLQIIEQFLESESFTVTRINTAPFLLPNYLHSSVQLSSSLQRLPRLIQTIRSAISFSIKQKVNRRASSLWLYNARFTEFIVAIIFLTFNPRLRLILQVEDLPFARSSNAGLSGIADFISLFLISSLSSQIFAVSPVVANRLTSIYRVNPSRVAIFPPILTQNLISIVKSRIEPFSSGVTSILYAGGYGPEKGVDDLISAFLSLDPSLFRLVLIGPIPQRLLPVYSSIQSVFCVGSISSSDLYKYYATADVVVSPHRVSLTSSFIFPFKIIELVASGALPLLTPMPGTELLDLPSICYYSSIKELSDKLNNSSMIWSYSRTILSRASQKIIEAYSETSLFPVLSKILSDTTFS